MYKNVYVASSWRNPYQPAVVAACKSAGIEAYDFKDSEGFHWTETRPGYETDGHGFNEYMEMLSHERALTGFARDFSAMQRAEACILVLPAGRSANLEAGWFIGQGKPTCIYIPEYDTPDLMYRMAQYITDDMMELLAWLGVRD